MTYPAHVKRARRGRTFSCRLPLRVQKDVHAQFTQTRE
jgi:hypothetical protein